MAKVLIVDDDPNIRINLGMDFEDEGHEVFLAEDGHLGYDMTVAYKPKIIFLDYHMPKRNGLDMARHVRRTPEVRDTYIVGIGSFPPTPDGSIDEFIKKGDHISDLGEVCLEALAKIINAA